MTMRIRAMPALVVLAAGACGCAAQAPAEGDAAAPAAQLASGADRQGHFDRSAGDISLCVGMAAHAAHPELAFDLNVSPPQSVGAKKYQSDVTNIWTAEFHEAGSNASDVVLKNSTASPGDLAEVWRIIEQCAQA
jgi:hypothetical protein